MYMKKTLLFLTFTSLFTFLYLSSDNNTSDNDNIDNNKNNGGIFDGNTNNAQNQIFSRIDWKNDKYFKFKDDSENNPNYQGDRFYTNWTATPVPNGKNPNTDAQVRANLPNTGSLMYTRNNFGADVLQSNLWNNKITYRSNLGGLLTKIGENTYTLSPNTATVNEASQLVNINSYMNFGIDFGETFGIAKLFTDSNDNVQKTPKYAFYDDSHVFNDILSNNYNNSIFWSPLNIYVPHAERSNSYNPLDFSSSVLAKYYSMQKSLPYYGNTFEVRKLNSNDIQKYYLGSFGMSYLNSYFTFTIEKIEDVSENSNKYDELNIIIDKNNSKLGMESEIDSLFRLSQNIDYSGNYNPYSEDYKRAVIDSFNGKNINNNDFINKWGIVKREAISTNSKNNFTSISNDGFYNATPITADKKDNNFPDRDINTGFLPNDFSNSYIKQVWSENKNIDSNPDKAFLNGFHSEFNLNDGYYRDPERGSTNTTYYAPNNYSVYDAAFVYNTHFIYNASLNGNDYFIGNYQGYSQTAMSLKNSTSGNPASSSGFAYNPTQRVYNTYNTGNDNYKINVIFSSVNNLTKGAIASSIIILFFVIIGLGFGFHVLTKKRKKD